jgi:hypothetical protein
MVLLLDLWLPILLSAVLVFLASSVIHMALRWHASDFKSLTSTGTFVGYALAVWQSGIWYSRSLGATVRTTIDGFVYALLTGGAFAWLWP